MATKTRKPSAKSAPVMGRDELAAPHDEFAATDDADLTYISAGLRALAVRIDSLVLDDQNVKDHGDEDLPTHAASLREFGIRRAVVVRRSNRQIEAGNGTVMAAKLNGWEFVPAIFEDDDHCRAKGFALADNACGTLAPWNDTNLAALAAEVNELYQDDALRGMTDLLLADLEDLHTELEEGSDTATDEPSSPAVSPTETPTETTAASPPGTLVGDMKPEDVIVSYRVMATCKDQDAQIKLLAELENRGFECRLSSVRINP